jgi:hypothetical protein
MSHLRSPILDLQNAIAGCAFRIAPERENELAKLRDLTNLTLALVDEAGFSIRVRLPEHEVVVNIAALEFLWASAHAHLILYNEYSLAQRTGSSTFDTGGTERSRNAMELLAWAGRNVLGDGTDPWPALLPRPERFPIERTDGHFANELFLCALAWIIHHEIAHIRLSHQALITTSSIAEEKDADIAATKWILDKSTVPQESRKRTFGIAAAILALQGFRSPDQFVALKTHPSTFERIDYCLTVAGVPEDDEVFAFSAVTMQIQLACLGVNKRFDGKTFRELYSEYLVEFARTNTG